MADYQVEDHECSRVLQRRGTIIGNTAPPLDDDLICSNRATRDVIVTFNGNAYLVPLCAEHGAQHDRAAADRRAARQRANREAAERHAESRKIKEVVFDGRD